MIGTSKEYKEGFNSRANKNPYDVSTREYNDFERGWSQRVKRGGSYESAYTMESIKAKPLKETYRKSDIELPSSFIKYGSYSEAKSE